MASVIRIKRSDSNGNPSTLAAGELAYSGLAGTLSNGGDRLYIGQGVETGGNAANHVVIGGKYFTDMMDHTPGVLTTSSAIITDANNKIDILNVDNITLNGNTISSTDSNGNIVLAPNGTGKISFYNAYTFPTTAGAVGYALVSDGNGGLTWSNASAADTATTATNIAGGTAGQVPYQTAPGVTSFYGPGTAGQLLVSGGTGAPTYTNTASIYVGNAVKSEKWATARTVTFTGDTTGTFTIDGSGDVSNVNLTIQPDSVALGTDTTGIYVSSGATSGFGISGSASTEGSTFTVTSNATSTNAASTIVYRDASGNFSAGTITASLTGNATSADKWSSARTITLDGDLSGNVTLDGSGNVTLTATIAANSVALGTDTTGNYVATGATSGFGISGSSSSEGGTFTVSSNATSTNSASTLVYRDASGNFAAGTVTADLTGTATTATNIAGGTAGQLSYQTAAGATGFTGGSGSAGQVLVGNGTAAPTFQSTLTLAGTTAATSTNTGALQVVGGVGIGGDLYVGGEIVAQKLTIQYTTVTTTLVTTDDVIKTTNGTNASSTTTGALQITGGAGIGGNLYVGGTIYGNIDGSITTATNLAGGTAGQLVYQSAAGVTGFTGPGTVGQLLVSGGTGAPTYTNTGSIYVGNAVNSEKWSAARTITLAGDLSGSVAIDGSSNVTLTATVSIDSIALGTDTTGIYVASGATSGFGISGSSSSEGGTFTVTSNATSTNAASTIVYRDANGNFSASAVTADLVGTATTATNLTGGAAGSVPYQTAAGATTFLALGSPGKVLQVSTNTNEIVWGDIDGGTY